MSKTSITIDPQRRHIERTNKSFNNNLPDRIFSYINFSLNCLDINVHKHNFKALFPLCEDIDYLTPLYTANNEQRLHYYLQPLL